MPFVEIKILDGLTVEQRAGLVADVTRSLVDRCGKKPESVHIVIHEVPRDNWGNAGQLISARDAQPSIFKGDASADVGQ